MAPSQTHLIGQTIAHYKVTAKLGKGGMGEVYRAHDKQLDRDVALKVLPASSFSDPAARARLLREARSAAALNHPNICTIHEVGEAEGQAYIAMELVEGQSLSTRLADGALPTDQVLRYGLQLAEALAHAHERGIVHRDLKSANAIITPEGRAKVLDFGLAKRSGEAELDEATRSRAPLTRPGAIAGTLAYMAPEQLRGQPADARSDIWALGIVLYEMAAGSRPFEGQTGFELSSAILNERPEPLAGKVPVQFRALIALIERCLEKEPGRRYQRAAEVRAALETIQTGTAAPWAGWRYHLTRRRWLALAAALVAAVGILVGSNVGGLRTWLIGGPSAPRIQSLAVLPLVNQTGDAEQAYFVDGMTEMLITQLAKMGGLQRVISGSSVMRYKGSQKPLSEIARELKVDVLVTGAVLRAGERVRITAQVIEPKTGQLTWAEDYERDTSDVLTLQGELARAIAQEIRITLSPEQQQELAAPRHVNPVVYKLYLKGRFHTERYTEEDVRRGIGYYRQALAKDARYAPAYAGLAEAYYLISSQFLAPRQAMPQVRDAAQQALQIDETLAEAHTSLALVKAFYEYDFSGAEKEFQRAVQLNSASSSVHQWYGYFLVTLGRWQQARAELTRARELDPFSGLVESMLGISFLFGGDLDDAVRDLRKAADLDPDLWWARFFLAMAYSQKGMIQPAVAELQKAAQTSASAWPSAYLGYLSARSGKLGEAREIVRSLERQSQLKYVSPYSIAIIYVGLGETKRALDWLEKAYEARDDALLFLRFDPACNPLRPEPRFHDLLQRIGAPQ